jgi:hypothetical protein
MALSAFDDKSREPGARELAAVLAETADLWDELRSSLASRFDPLSEEWVFSGKKWGWALRLKHKKRAVLYMTPCGGYFTAGFAIGQKAFEAARQSDLPRSFLDVIDNSQRYAEGRAVRVDVRNAEDLGNVIQLATIKMAN